MLVLFGSKLKTPPTILYAGTTGICIRNARILLRETRIVDQSATIKI